MLQRTLNPVPSVQTLLASLLLFAASMLMAADKPQLTIHGLSGEPLQNVQQGLSLSHQSCDTARWRINRLFKGADQEIMLALRAVGYYQPKISKQLSYESGCWAASFTIQIGPAITVKERTIVVSGEMESAPSLLALKKNLPLEPGAVLHHGRYEELKRKLQDLATEQGYFDARFNKKELRVEPASASAHITLHFDSGERYRFGNLQISQQPYSQTLLDKHIPIIPGTPYTASQIQTTRSNLANSGYFEQVQVRPLPSVTATKEVPIAIELQPRKRHGYRLSLGASTDTGLRMAAGYENRRINKRGHRLAAELSFSSVISEAGVEYTIPVYNSPWKKSSFQAGYRDEATDNVQSQLWKTGMRLLRNRHGWNETWSLNLQQEHSIIENKVVDSLLLFPGLAWNRTKADDLIRPRKGERLQLDLRGAYEGLLSDTSFIQAKASGKWITGLGRASVIGRVDLGMTLTDQFDNLPSSLRFFTGGDQTVRGYDYHSLGPRDANNKPVGGRHLVVLSAEYEYPILKDWGAALFIDSGNAFDGSDDGLKTGVGVGARWYSPVGPVRLDLAFPMDNEEDSFRIHFSFGSLL